MNKRAKRKLIVVLAAIILLVVFIPQHTTRAFLDIGNVASDAVNQVVYFILYAVFQGAGSALGFFAGLLDQFVKLSSSSYPDAVRASWEIIRNFANMFFILALIIMAFGTIFDLPKFHWRNMLVPFLIAALLINFSFVIGSYIISVADGLTGVFLRQIGNVSNISNGLALGSITYQGKDVTAALGGATATLTLITGLLFITIFTVISLFAMMTAAIFVVVRIVVLWFLLLVSPLAWVGSIFPNLRSQTWSKWWSAFISWTFSLPIYIFFLSFAFIFLNAKPQLATKVELSSANVGNILGALFTFNDILFYIITLLFMIGGLAMAFKVGGVGGNGVNKVFGVIQTGVKKYSGYTGYTKAAKAGLAAKGEEIGEKGVLGIGGAQAARLRQAWVTEKLGFGAARGTADKAHSEEIDKEFTRLKQLNLDQSTLSARMQSAKGLERAAALKLRAENGWLAPADLDEINKTLGSLGGGRSIAGSSLVNSLKKGKFEEMAKSTAEKEMIFNGLQDAELKKAFGLSMAEGKDINTPALATELLNLYAGEAADVKKKVEETIKGSVENMAKDKTARLALIIDPATDPRLKKLVGQVMADKKEVDNWALRRTILEANGGIDPATGEALTAEGRELAKNIKDGNVAIKEEADYRKARPAISATADLSPTQYTELENQIVDNVKTGLIRSLSTEELKSPAIFNALYNGKATGSLSTDEFNKALGVAVNKKTGVLEIKGKPDRKKRAAINDLLTATSPMSYP